MKIYFQQKLLFIVLGCFLTSPILADNLGRIFTTEDERVKLEKIRSVKEPIKKIEEKEVIKKEEPIIVKKETIVRDPITLKGIVHRSGSRSTAWVNDNNTFEGNLDSQIIQIPENKIKPDQVRIILPVDNTQFELKVGDVFTPPPIERELVETVNTDDN